MARPTPRARRQSRGGRGGGLLDRAFAHLLRWLALLNDPSNMAAHLAVAAVLLAAEAVLCLLIIRRVPCEWRRCVWAKPRPLGACRPTWCQQPPCGVHPRSACPRTTPCKHPFLASFPWFATALQTRRLTGWHTCRR